MGFYFLKKTRENAFKNMLDEYVGRQKQGLKGFETEIANEQ